MAAILHNPYEKYYTRKWLQENVGTSNLELNAFFKTKKQKTPNSDTIFYNGALVLVGLIFAVDGLVLGRLPVQHIIEKLLLSLVQNQKPLENAFGEIEYKPTPLGALKFELDLNSQNSLKLQRILEYKASISSQNKIVKGFKFLIGGVSKIVYIVVCKPCSLVSQIPKEVLIEGASFLLFTFSIYTIISKSINIVRSFESVQQLSNHIQVHVVLDVNIPAVPFPFHHIDVPDF